MVIYPASGTGAWEAALVNTLSPGDTVLMYETGHFATLWQKMAEQLALEARVHRRRLAPRRRPAKHRSAPARRHGHQIKAVCVVHNETSTGVTSDIAAVRRAIDRAGHPALLLVDTISSLGSIDYRHDEWGVDVTVAGSQKGLMLPPGLSFNAVSQKALAASRTAKLPRAFWDWDEIIEANKNGFLPYTPATNLLYGLRRRCDMLLEEGLHNVFARHQRHAEATRRACAPGAWRSCARTRPSTRRADRGADAARRQRRAPQRRCAAQDHPRRNSTCRSARAWASSRAGCSASATWATSTT